MSVAIWRIATARPGLPATDLSGNGAAIAGGRWNSPGKSFIYTSSTLSLACLEVLVHIRDPSLVPEYDYCRIDIPDDSLEQWPFEAGDARYQAILKSEMLSREIADRWLDGSSNLSLWERFRPVLEVPSAVVRQEWNYLINPRHPRYFEVEWSPPSRFEFEPRLLDPLLR